MNRRTFLANASLAAGGLLVPSAAARASAGNAEKTKTIVIRSSWNDHNIGDIGHTPGTLRLLEKYVPEAQVVLWHAAPRPVTEALIAANFPNVRLIGGGFSTEEADNVVRAALDKADLYIHNSGMSMNYGLFNHEWGSTMTNLAPMYYCLEKRIPFGLYGHSFDRFASPSELIYRDVLSRAAFIYGRDTESVKFLKEKGFRTPVLEFGPDGCFGIDVRDEKQGTDYLLQNDLEEKKFLVVVIRTNTPHLNATGKGDLMNPAPSAEQQAQDRQRLDKVKHLINTWVRTTGNKVLIAPEALKETRYGKTMLYEQLDADVRAKVVCRETFWSADEAMSVYARAHTIFGMEPHSLIMGLALGVPILHARPVSNGRKGWMFRDIGLPEWLFDIDQASAGDITGELMKIVKNYPQAGEKVRKAMAFVADRQKATMQVVRKNIKLAS